MQGHVSRFVEEGAMQRNAEGKEMEIGLTCANRVPANPGSIYIVTCGVGLKQAGTVAQGYLYCPKCNATWSEGKEPTK
jgi:hypothetical protein